jgi:hypothetical protein
MLKMNPKHKWLTILQNQLFFLQSSLYNKSCINTFQSMQFNAGGIIYMEKLKFYHFQNPSLNRLTNVSNSTFWGRKYLKPCVSMWASMLCESRVWVNIYKMLFSVTYSTFLNCTVVKTTSSGISLLKIKFQFVTSYIQPLCALLHL